MGSWCPRASATASPRPHFFCPSAQAVFEPWPQLLYRRPTEAAVQAGRQVEPALVRDVADIDGCTARQPLVITVVELGKPESQIGGASAGNAY